MSRIKELLKNLPIALTLNEKNNSLDVNCTDCSKIIHYEIRQRNIKEPPYYCRSCTQQHKHFSKEALQNIANGAKKRSGEGICTKCGKKSLKRNASGLCPNCFSYINDIAKNQKLPGNCAICGIHNEVRDQNGRGKDNCSCSKDFYQKHNSSDIMINIIKERNIDQNITIECKKHGHQDFSFAGKCIMCINESKDYESQSKLRTETILKAIEDGDLDHWPGGMIPNFITKNKVRFYKGQDINKIINKLNSEEYNVKDFPGFNKRFGEWYYKTENILTGDLTILSRSNFVIKDNVKFFKLNNDYIPVEDIINMIETNNIVTPDNWNKRFGKWHYKTVDILTGDINLLSGINFIERNNVEFYLNKVTGKYVPWNDFKEEFQYNNISNDAINKIKIKYGGDYCPTFITKESSVNCGHAAFDKLLIEKNTNYFVYIKFYTNNNNKIVPLVIGQSGSFNVNSNGSDLSFSNEVNHGPSSKFLLDKGLDYYYNEIFVIKTKSREESLSIEKSIQKEYSLFSS